MYYLNLYKCLSKKYLTDKNYFNDRELHAIICNHVTKIYDSKIAVDSVDLKIKYGEYIGAFWDLMGQEKLQ